MMLEKPISTRVRWRLCAQSYSPCVLLDKYDLPATVRMLLKSYKIHIVTRSPFESRCFDPHRPSCLSRCHQAIPTPHRLVHYSSTIAGAVIRCPTNSGLVDRAALATSSSSSYLDHHSVKIICARGISETRSSKMGERITREVYRDRVVTPGMASSSC